jgi:hypothetical protein
VEWYAEVHGRLLEFIENDLEQGHPMSQRVDLTGNLTFDLSVGLDLAAIRDRFVRGQVHLSRTWQKPMPVGPAEPKQLELPRTAYGAVFR